MADIPSQGQPISDFDAGTLTASSLIAMSYPRAATGMSTGKISAAAFGQGMGENVMFSGLNTADKTLFGAINEISEMMPQNYTSKSFTANPPPMPGATLMWFDDFFDSKAMYMLFTDNNLLVIDWVYISDGSASLKPTEDITTTTVFKFVRIGYEEAPAPVDTLPHGISPKDVITLTVPTGEAIVNAVLWGEPSNNNSGWLWALTETGATITYNTSNNSTNSVRAYSTWVSGLLNKVVVNCRNNPTTLPSLGEPGSRSCSGAARKVLFNTLDIYDQNGDVLYPKNCTLADFGIEE